MCRYHDTDFSCVCMHWTILSMFVQQWNLKCFSNNRQSFEKKKTHDIIICGMALSSTQYQCWSALKYKYSTHSVQKVVLVCHLPVYIYWRKCVSDQSVNSPEMGKVRPLWCWSFTLPGVYSTFRVKLNAKWKALSFKKKKENCPSFYLDFWYRFYFCIVSLKLGQHTHRNVCVGELEVIYVLFRPALISLSWFRTRHEALQKLAIFFQHSQEEFGDISESGGATPTKYSRLIEVSFSLFNVNIQCFKLVP